MTGKEFNVVKEKYLINEAAKEVHVESHVLRYWEEELELPIRRNEQGHRVYTQEDIDRFITIKNLKDQGLQLKAVKTLLEQVHSDDGGEDDMRADNPFAQKQMTKISKAGEAKTVPVKNAEDIRWSERFGSKKHETPNEALEEPVNDAAPVSRSSMKNMIEIKEMRPVGEESSYENSSQLEEASREQTMRLQYLFQKLIKEAVAANNEELAEHLIERITENVKGDICKELDYQFRLMEERDDERVTNRHEQEDKRNEEYYKRIDELLRQYSGKSTKQKEKTKDKNKDKNKDKTILFPSSKNKSEEKGDTKAKKEFHLFRKTVEAK
ncbi:MAG: MerR family transcriptional regulator [Lachnospiraceae bacterium]|nr:MerR family transcriptional regulator [Lachnospiraceae bacterium]